MSSIIGGGALPLALTPTPTHTSSPSEGGSANGAPEPATSEPSTTQAAPIATQDTGGSNAAPPADAPSASEPSVSFRSTAPQSSLAQADNGAGTSDRSITEKVVSSRKANEAVGDQLKAASADAQPEIARLFDAFVRQLGKAHNPAVGLAR